MSRGRDHVYSFSPNTWNHSKVVVLEPETWNHWVIQPTRRRNWSPVLRGFPDKEADFPIIINRAEGQ